MPSLARAFEWRLDSPPDLAGTVRRHNRAVTKTIGDAVMAAFADPGDAMHAAFAIHQREVPVAFYRPGPGTWMP